MAHSRENLHLIIDENVRFQGGGRGVAKRVLFVRSGKMYTIGNDPLGINAALGNTH